MFEALESYSWPGNVRELASLAERLVVFGGDPITVHQLPASLSEGGHPPAGGLVRLDPGFSVLPLKEFRSLCEKEYIDRVLRRTGWNVSAAARLLDIQRTHLHQKLAALGSRRPGGSTDP